MGEGGAVAALGGPATLARGASGAAPCAAYVAWHSKGTERCVKFS